MQRAVETKALEALAVGNLPPGRELELISALDLGTVPWGQLPIRFKERLGLPLQEPRVGEGADGNLLELVSSREKPEIRLGSCDARNLKRVARLMQDRGIDSLALNLSVAVQAKDYEASVPLRSLATFHLLVRAEGSPLRDKARCQLASALSVHETHVYHSSSARGALLFVPKKPALLGRVSFHFVAWSGGAHGCRHQREHAAAAGMGMDGCQAPEVHREGDRTLARQGAQASGG